MSECKWTERVEAYHDGEIAHATGVAEHLEGCTACRDYLGLLQTVSAGVAASKPDAVIADAQFRVFMDGVREGIEAKPSVWNIFFTKLSLYAAGLILVVALSSMLLSPPVRAWAASWFSPVVEINESGGDKADNAPAQNGNGKPVLKGVIE